MTESEKLFNQSSNQTSSIQAQGAEDEDWATVTLPSRTRGQATDIIPPTAMPTLEELPRPEIILAAQTPYHMIVKVVHNGIIVQCSHQGSLELLAGYVQKYTRDTPNQAVKVSCAHRLRQRNSVYPQDQSIGRTLILHPQIPLLKAELQISHFGYGAMFDSLTITPGDPRSD